MTGLAGGNCGFQIRMVVKITVQNRVIGRRPGLRWVSGVPFLPVALIAGRLSVSPTAQVNAVTALAVALRVHGRLGVSHPKLQGVVSPYLPFLCWL